MKQSNGYADFFSPMVSSHVTMRFSESATTLLESVSPSVRTVAFGSSSSIYSTESENPLPPWLLNGMIVFPLKSYSEKKLYISCGISYHQMG